MFIESFYRVDPSISCRSKLKLHFYKRWTTQAAKHVQFNHQTSFRKIASISPKKLTYVQSDNPTTIRIQNKAYYLEIELGLLHKR